MEKKYHKSRFRADTFGFIDFVLEFDFCDKDEKKELYRCLKQAWAWTCPSLKDNKKNNVTE